MKDNLDKIIKEVSSAPMRSSIITAAALIDSTLKILIEKKLIENCPKDIFDIRGCLGTFSAKNDMAYAMGLISKELYEDIKSYGKIRNKCAHNFVLDVKNIRSITDTAKQFKMLNAAFKYGKNEDVRFYTGLEFAIILVALIKRINNVDKCVACAFEVRNDDLKFDDDDYKLLTHFDETFKNIIQK